MKEPFMNHMFPKAYMEPWERNFLPRTEDVTIYSCYEKFTDEREMYCEYCDKKLGFDDNDDIEGCDCKDARDKNSGFPKLSQITLQSILDMLPEGVKPSDVKISIGLDVGAMGVDGHEITFYYKKTFEADPEGFKAAQKQYEENYKLYLVEREKYDEWKKQQEIKKLEETLANLKK